MIEITINMKMVLYELNEKIGDEGWAIIQEWLYHTDSFGNRHKNIGIRFVRYSESFFGFLQHFGVESYFPLMVFWEEPIPDDKWDSDLDAFVPWAKQRGLTVNELIALAAVFNGRTENNKDPLVAVLAEKIGEMLENANRLGYYRLRATV